MPITQAMCTSFKAETFEGIHDVLTDDIRIALYTDVASLNAATTVYSATNEASGTGYTAGGQTLTNVVIGISGTMAYVDADNPVWTASTITARGALIYNFSKANRAIGVIDFGANKTSSASDFEIQFPAPGVNAIIRYE